VARAEPIVEVSHPLAKVTHEAAVGTVDQNQLETLMARGLSPEEAIDVIVTGILRWCQGRRTSTPMDYLEQ
jgi:Fe-S cluster assembly scaffold protein SufB